MVFNTQNGYAILCVDINRLGWTLTIDRSLRRRLLYTTELLAQTISRFIILQQNFVFWEYLFKEVTRKIYFKSITNL